MATYPQRALSWDERRESDYEVRLVDFVRRWEKVNPEKAAALREMARQKIGMPEKMVREPIHALILERAYREEVRKAAGKPSLESFMRGGS